MKKYVCNICGYVYDPAVGIRTPVCPRAFLLRTFPRTGHARFAGPGRTNSHRSKSFPFR